MGEVIDVLGSLKEVGIIIGEASSVSFDFSSKPSEMPSRWEYLMINSEEEQDGEKKQVQVLLRLRSYVGCFQALTKELNLI